MSDIVHVGSLRFVSNVIIFVLNDWTYLIFTDGLYLVTIYYFEKIHYYKSSHSFLVY